MNIVNCPNCGGVVMKTESVDMRSSVSMDMRCPHCRRGVSVRIYLEVVFEVNGKKTNSGREPNIREM